MQDIDMKKTIADDFVKSRERDNGLPHFDFTGGLFNRNHPLRETGFDFTWASKLILILLAIMVSVYCCLMLGKC